MNSMHNPTTEALMQLHAAVLFTYNPAGRMLQANEPWPDRGPAPRFFLGLPLTGTPVRRYREDLPQALIQSLEAVAVTAMPDGAPQQLSQYRQLLQSDQWEGGPSFLVPETLTTATPAIHLTREHTPVIGPEFPWLAQELDMVQPCAAVVENGQVVSVCRSVRITAAAHEAGIETPGPFRGRGYAIAVLALWAAMVRDMGALPLYSTSWNNQASRNVARKAGLICYGSTLSIS